MKRALNWKSFGQFLAALLKLFTLIRDTFEEMGVGLEIVPHLLSKGRFAFVAKLKEIGQQYLDATQRVRVIDENTISVNLDAPIAFPLPNSSAFYTGIDRRGGWVTVQRRGDELYVEGQKVTLFVHHHQSSGDYQGSKITGHYLRLRGPTWKSLHPNILDGLLEHPQMVPNWAQGRKDTLRIGFWLVIFRDDSNRFQGLVDRLLKAETNAGLYVRCLGINPNGTLMTEEIFLNNRFLKNWQMAVLGEQAKA